MRLYKRGKTWWVSIYLDGRRERVSTQCHDRTAAEARARQLERDAADPAGAAAKKATLGDALALLLNERASQVKAKRRSPDTVDFYRKKAAQLTRVFEGDAQSYVPFRLARLQADDVDRYVAQRRNEGVSDSTIAKELVTLRASLKLALRARIWSGNVAAIVPIAFSPRYRARKRFLTPDEAGKLLKQLAPDRAARVAFMLATSAEWRATELAVRYDVKEHEVRLRGTKRETRERTVPVVLHWQRKLLELCLAGAGGHGGMLFEPWGNVRRDLYAACKRAGIHPCTPNDIRRSFAHWMGSEGVPNETIAPMMGHKDTRMLDRVYHQKTPAELAAAVLRASGADCDTGVPTRWRKLAGVAASAAATPSRNGVPGDGIEPSTRGFSVPKSFAPKWRSYSGNSGGVRRRVTRVCRSHRAGRVR